MILEKNMKRLLIIFLAFALFSCSNEVPTPKVQKSGIPDKPENVNPLKVGDIFPEIMLKDQFSEEFNLSEVIASKPSIIIYYRGGWCFYCNLHFGQLQDVVLDLKRLGFGLYAISPDLPKNLAETTKRHELDYLLLSDPDLNIAKKLGIAYIKKRASESNSGKDEFLSVPSVFIVGTDNKIKFEYFNSNYKQRIAPGELLKAAESIIN